MKNLQIIEDGHTNIKYIKDNKFFVEKIHNQFNHKINYHLTQKFNFVPQLIKASSQMLEWALINNAQHLLNPSNQDLIKVANIINEIHHSNLAFPKNNLRKRVQFYLKTMSEKHLSIPEVNLHYKPMMKILANMNHNLPSHNDVWPQNLIKDQDHKIWLVDWEYATMGDIYFDLSYFIEAANLNIEQREIFINQYLSLNPTNDFNFEILLKYRLFVNWLTLLWAYSQPTIPFDLTNVKAFLNQDIKKVGSK